MVAHQVAGDGDQPGPDVTALPLAHRPDPAQRPQEGLTGEVLSQLALTQVSAPATAALRHARPTASEVRSDSPITTTSPMTR